MEISLKVNDNIRLVNPKVERSIEMLNLINSNRNFLNKYITFAENKNDLKNVSSFLREIASFNIGGQKFNLLIEYDGQLIGLIGFHRIDRANARAEIGYWMAEQYQGRGIMSMSLPIFLHYGFEALAINKVELLTLTDHHKNMKMVEGLGFVKEGMLKEHFFMFDSFQDVLVYRMLKSDFLVNNRAQGRSDMR